MVYSATIQPDKKYLTERLLEAETKRALLGEAIIKRIERVDPDPDGLYRMCKLYVEAYDEERFARENLNECCNHEGCSEESPKV